MKEKNKQAMKLPDALIVRYFRQGELDQVTRVSTTRKDKKLRVAVAGRVDIWQDLGGGLGYVPDTAS